MGDIIQDDPPGRRRRGVAAADEAGPSAEVSDEVEPVCEECAPRVVAPDPGQPTQKEIEEHRIDHMPFRSWCEHCVAGRATGEQHRTADDKRLVPVISFDYLFVLKSGKLVERSEVHEQEVQVKILVVKDKKSRAVFAHLVQQKGADADGYAVECLRRDIQWLGYARLVLRSDNEPAIVNLLKESLKELRVSNIEQCQEEHSVAYDSKDNGAVENACKQVQGHLRTHRSCLESRLGVRIPVQHPAFAWLVEHVAWLITVRLRGADGRTSHQLAKGHEFGKRLVGFAEWCLYKKPLKKIQKQEEKLERRWEHAVCLGYSRTSNEYIFYRTGEVFKAREIQRVPLEQRWSADAVQAIDREPINDHVRRQDVLFRREEGLGADPLEGRKPQPRSFWITTKDLVQFGYTAGCRACDHMVRHSTRKGPPGVPHSQACRARIRAGLEGTEEGRRRVQRSDERADRHMADQGWGAEPASKEEEPEDLEHAENPEDGHRLAE